MAKEVADPVVVRSFRVGEVVFVVHQGWHYGEYGVVTEVGEDSLSVQSLTGAFDVPADLVETEATSDFNWAPPEEVLLLAREAEARVRSAGAG